MNFDFTAEIFRFAKDRYARLWVWVAFATLFLAAFLIISSEVREASSGQTELIGTIDSVAISFVSGIRTPTLSGIAVDITALGSATTITFFVLVTSILLVFRRRYLQMGHLVVAAVGSAIVSSIMKSYFERPRPYGLAHLVDVQGYSYPSGHSLSSASVYFTFAVLLCQDFRKPVEHSLIVGLTLSLIFLIALSRVYLGVHYLSDTIGGVLVGIGWAAILGAISSLAEVRRQRHDLK